MNTQNLPPTIRAWVEADRHKDLAQMKAQLSDDAHLISPLTDQFTFTGADEVMAVFEAAFDLLTDIEIAGVTGNGTQWVVYGTNKLGGNNLEEIQWLELNEACKIHKVTLFIRPVPAPVELLSKIGPGLHRRGAMGKGGAIASRAATPLAAALRLTEKFVMPRIKRGPTPRTND